MSEAKGVPGCYGAASVFSHDSDICKTCSHFEACSDESLKTLESIRGLVNVTDLLKRHDDAKRKMARRMTAEELASKVEAKITQPVERVTGVEVVKFSIPVEHELILAKMKIKPREQARNLCNQGLIEKIKEGIQEGRNALANSRPRFMSVAIDGLIDGGFDKRELKELFLTKTEMGDSAAASHVSITLPILLDFCIAQEIAGRIVAAPELRS